MKTINKILDSLFLYLSDCDGMCNLCNQDLRELCQSEDKEDVKKYAHIGMWGALLGLIIIIIILKFTNN